ncbi:hypothetical protein CFR73_08075 [Novacetimonas maltaceti]|uniref:DUF1343 domain-containing protein n=1 Tax=Novacetimonas maltaceti TaxID=1203393 RepID=A0A2S3W535_9PROT|nr:DUF1343 domain-containing protein [Novacetimonas maltaceti]POF63947.1 hypothetical protein KMAL_04800 [Novacetimonas maltaceti]PYD60340.1 hypothetical protein CFR73_08075 [Novacetimonas maltaceti]
MKLTRRAVMGGGIALCGGAFAGASGAFAKNPACDGNVVHAVRTGFEGLRADGYGMLQGRKVGLVANPTSVGRNLHHIADIIHADASINLQAIFGPEHGFRGSAPAGASEAKARDANTGVMVYDIYNVSGSRLDAIIRSSGIDTMVFDIQDVGARFYTYISTLHDTMAACARLGIDYVVLDRPNPISGTRVGGPVLDPRFASFVGRQAIPIQHGMTVCELAGLFNACFIPAVSGRPVQLRHVGMKGWTRDLFFDQTDLPWVPPSPNMPTVQTAIVYPGTCLFEGTDLSVGRGTAMPFLYLGGPRLDATAWRDRMEQSGLPGVAFRDVAFAPVAFVDKGAMDHGLQVLVTDRERFDAVRTGLTLLSTLRAVTGAVPWRGKDARTFDILMGTDTVRHQLDQGMAPDAIIRSWQPGLAKFMETRKKYMLYS